VIERFHDIMDIQSVGAAIQNMLLAAMDFDRHAEAPPVRSRKPIEQVAELME